MMLHYNTLISDGEDPITGGLHAFSREIEAFECAREQTLSPLQRSQIAAMDAAFDDLFSNDDDAEIADDVLSKSATIQVQEKPALSSHLQSVSDYRVRTCAVAPITLPKSTTTSTYTKPTKRKVKGKVRAAPRTPRKRLSPSWREATPAQKFTKAVRITATSDAYAFSLNLSSDRQRALVQAADPIRLFSGYLNRELKRAGLAGTPYAFTFELSPDGKKLHLHGVVIPGTEPAATLKRALQAAGGKIEGHAGSRQLKLDPITDAAGWAAYCQKQAWLTDKVVDGNRLTFINADLNRMTREYAPQRLAA